MIRRVLVVSALTLFLIQTAGAMTPQEQKEYRDKLLETLPPVTGRGGNGPDTFKQWVEKTDALPPDFDALPKHNALPDPFLFFDGKRTVKTADDWNQRREEIKQLFEKYIIGTIPPKPKIDQIVEVDPAVAAAEAARGRGGFGRGGGFGARGRRGGAATAPAADAQAEGAPTTAPATGGARRGARGGARGGRGGGFAGPGGGGRGPASAPGSITKIVDLKYGPNDQITTRVTLTIPPGNGPFPVYIHGGTGATNYGYIACEFDDNVDAPPNIGQFYPDYDWGSMAKIAWTTQMVVDYLYTLPEVDKPHIAITGYSRWGKMAILAAALEDRITAVVIGSGGVGGALSWRNAGEKNIAEGIETTTRPYAIWYKEAFRFFSGREDRLPVDQNLLVELMAPRSTLILYGLNDEVNSTWGDEFAYWDAQKVYKFTGKPDAVGILRIDGVGKHHGANDVPGSMKWLDIQFGRSQEKWENKVMFPWNYDNWKAATKALTDVSKFPQHSANEAIAGAGSEKDWKSQSDKILASVRTMLGTPPSSSVLAETPVTNPGDEGIDDTPRWVINRPGVIEHGWTATGQAAGIAGATPETMDSVHNIRFGPGKIRADIYYKEGTPENAKLPTVIWLHGLSYPMGYMFVYRWDPHPILALAHAGYAVVAYDQSGFGSRMDETAHFYDKYPQWSQFGRMVQDVQDAVEAAKKDPMCDPDRIYVFGYGLGGTVGLYSAALDKDVKGVVSICGFTPMRSDTVDKGTGGIARWSNERGLIPQLGAFIGQEPRIPYDYNELVATIAPRPVYVYDPIYDRDATASDVKQAVDQAQVVYKQVYNAPDKLVLDQPWDYFRLSLEAQNRIVDWMTKNMH